MFWPELNCDLSNGYRYLIKFHSLKKKHNQVHKDSGEIHLDVNS